MFCAYLDVGYTGHQLSRSVQTLECLVGPVDNGSVPTPSVGRLPGPRQRSALSAYEKFWNSCHGIDRRGIRTHLVFAHHIIIHMTDGD